MQENTLKPKGLVQTQELSKATVSKILNHQRPFKRKHPKTVHAFYISVWYKMAQEAFDRPYRLMEAKVLHSVLPHEYPSIGFVPYVLTVFQKKT